MKKSIVLLVLLFSVTVALTQQKHKDTILKNIQEYEIRHNFNEAYIDDLVALARLYRFRRPDSLKMLAIKALEKSDSLKYQKGRALSILRLGDYYSDVDEPELAFKKYEEAKIIALGNKEFAVQVEVLKSQALQYVFNGNGKEAVTRYYEAITLAREKNLFEAEGTLRHNLGYLYWSNELYDEAEKEYLIADSLWSVINDKNMQASTISNLALNALDKKDYSQAKKYAHLSIRSLKDKGKPLWSSRAYRVQGIWHISQGLYDEALKDILKSEEFLKQLNSPRDQLEINVLYANVFLGLNSILKAESMAIRAMKAAKELKDHNNLITCYQILESIAQKNKNKEKAFHFLELSKNLQDSINLRNQGENLKLIRAKLDFEREQSEQIEKNRKELSRQKTILGLTIGLVILLALILFLIIRNSKNQKRLNNELTQLNNSKNKVFSTIGNDLKKPIGTLQELLNLYKTKDITAEQLKNITPKLKENVDHSAFSLNNLLFWAQIQMKSLEVRPSDVLLKVAANEICSLYEEQLTRKNINVTCKIPKNTTVFVDKDHFSIILKNIISNAIKFSSNNKITFDVLQSVKTTQVLICDMGAGMDDELVSKILTKQDITPKKGTHNEKGTGLGLIVCQELLTLNKGKLEIESEPNRGSCFYITFPNHKQKSLIPVSGI